MSFYRSFLVLIILDILFLILVISLFAPLRGGQFDLQFPLLVWLFINYILIARNGINEMRQIHNADNFAFNLTNEYVKILQKYTKVLSNERSFFQKLLVFLLMITWVKPHIALSKRLWRLNPIHEEIWCPHCSKKLLITQNWCPNCNFNISTPFSYSNFLIWATIACFGFILLPVLILGFFESSSENHIFLILLYSYLCLFLIALVTERIHFQKILPRQPNSILLTFLLGLSLVFATFISFLMDKGLNSIVKESMQYSSVTFFVGFVMGGFILYYLVIELRFRKSTVQWSYSRCPRCSQILSKHSSSCPNCRQQLRTESQMRPEIEVETPTVAMKEEIISPIRFCPTCGTNRIENSSFCITCGYRFSQK